MCSTKCRWWTDAAPQGWSPAVLELEQSGTGAAEVEFGQLSVYVSGEKAVRPGMGTGGWGWGREAGTGTGGKWTLRGGTRGWVRVGADTGGDT